MKKAAGEEFDSKRVRLSDRILYALELAIEQEDVSISEALVRALELAMTVTPAAVNSWNAATIRRKSRTPWTACTRSRHKSPC